MTAGLSFLLVLSAPFLGQTDQNAAKLELTPGEASSVIGRVPPRIVYLTATAPNGTTGDLAAEGVTWGVIQWGPASTMTSITIAIDERDPQDPAIFIDANGDGDVRNDGEVPWPKVAPVNGNTPVDCRQTSIAAPGGRDGDDRLTIYRFSAEEAAARRIPPNALLFYADRAMSGQAMIGGRLRKATLLDPLHTGDFTFPAGRSDRLVMAIDANGDGTLRKNEITMVGQSFKAGDGYLKVARISPDGTTVQFEKGEAPKVRRVGAPRPGDDAPAFTAPGVDGQDVKFPDEYRGKIVLLDFWAMWCGPCVAELPNVVKVYEDFHDKGLEILGISFDQAGQAARLKAFTAQRKMPWRQVYEGKRFDSAVGRQYTIRGIPHMFLVDGDTGKVLASGNALRGPRLRPQVAKAIAEKGDGK